MRLEYALEDTVSCAAIFCRSRVRPGEFRSFLSTAETAVLDVRATNDPIDDILFVTAPMVNPQPDRLFINPFHLLLGTGALVLSAAEAIFAAAKLAFAALSSSTSLSFSRLIRSCSKRMEFPSSARRDSELGESVDNVIEILGWPTGREFGLEDIFSRV